MPTFKYRVIATGGQMSQGTVQASDMAGAIGSLRTSGVTLIDVSPAPDESASKAAKPSTKIRAASAILFGELAILLRAGLPLDRALTLAIDNVEPRSVATRFAPLLTDVREGRALSVAMAGATSIAGPVEIAMVEAGEANGDLDKALTRLSAMIEGAAELRRLITTAMIYPIALLIIAVGVVMMMMLFVVPQFEGLMASGKANLPAASQFVLAASRALRDHGLVMLLGLTGAFFALRIALARPSARLGFDRMILRVPQVGQLVQRAETAKFARTLGALVEGQVALPAGMQLAQRTLSNRHMAKMVASVAEGVREGGGLAAPLAATGALPDIAIGFIRTGEESSELGSMLTRLADVLDRDVRLRLDRFVAILTPMITVILGASVTGIIASIMSAILGFNELALAR